MGSIPLSRLVFSGGAAGSISLSRRAPFCIYFKPCLDMGLLSIAVVASYLYMRHFFKVYLVKPKVLLCNFERLVELTTLNYSH